MCRRCGRKSWTNTARRSPCTGPPYGRGQSVCDPRHADDVANDAIAEAARLMAAAPAEPELDHEPGRVAVCSAGDPDPADHGPRGNTSTRACRGRSNSVRSGAPFDHPDTDRIDCAARPVPLAVHAKSVEDRTVQPGPHPRRGPVRESPVHRLPRSAEGRRQLPHVQLRRRRRSYRPRPRRRTACTGASSAARHRPFIGYGVTGPLVTLVHCPDSTEITVRRRLRVSP